MQVNIKHRINAVQCDQTVRELRWPDGVVCPSCEAKQVIKRGFNDTEPARQRYACHNCDTRFESNSRSTAAFASSFTTCASEAKRCEARSLRYSSQKTLESNKSV